MDLFAAGSGEGVHLADSGGCGCLIACVSVSVGVRVPLAFLRAGSAGTGLLLSVLVAADVACGRCISVVD